MNKAANLTERLAQIISAALGLAFFLSGIVYLYQARRNLSHTDCWYLYDDCLNRPWRSTFGKYAGHSFLFPSLIWQLNIRFFHNDQELMFAVGTVLLFLTFAVAMNLVWRDETISTTTKLAATLILVVGNFWMIRAPITNSGAFNSTCSLAMGGALLSCFWLLQIRQQNQRTAVIWLFVIISGLVASFSFGAGLAVWPMLLALGWALRIMPRAVGILLLATFVAAAVYLALPENVQRDLPAHQVTPWALSLGPALPLLCRLIGAPVLYAQTAWTAGTVSRDAAASSLLSLLCGAAALVLAAACVLPSIIRRNLGRSSLEVLGFALIIFNFVALLLIVTGRAMQPTGDFGGFSSPRYVATAQRYLFWSPLFWTGLLLVMVRRLQSTSSRRWVALLLSLIIAVLVFPEHVRRAVAGRNVFFSIQSAGTSLINQVRDPATVRILWFNPEEVFRVAAQFRARRLDMFAAGLQDWIGQNETAVFGGRTKRFGVRGQLRIEALVSTDDGAPAARFTGTIVDEHDHLPQLLLVVDSTGAIRGIARPALFRGPINLRQKLFGFGPTGFVGYIRNYDSNERYFVRAVSGKTLSDDKLIVPAPPVAIKSS